jgi:CBS domain-containing protein
MASVSEIMTRGVRSMTPNDSVTQAAKAMDELNVGAIPVCDGDRLVGMVTDRDIVVRGVAQGMDMNSCKLSQVMSGHVRTVREDDEVQEVLDEMANAQIRRMPVVDTQDRLVGIVSLGDIAAKNPPDEGEVAESLGDISTPAEPDRDGEQATGGKAAPAGKAKGKRQPT